MLRSLMLMGAAALCGLAVPSQAQAWWYRPGYYRPRVVILPPPPVVVAPVVLPPPRVVYAPPVRRVWVPSHYNRYGVWLLGHWA